jgi:ankyrin repeat protein
MLFRYCLFYLLNMGDKCSKSQKIQKPQKSIRKNTEIKSEDQFSSVISDNASHRETINQYSLINFNLVRCLANQDKINHVRGHLEHGFVIDFPLDRSGWTLLHLACQKGNLEFLTMLLQYKPYLDAQETAEGWTPLMVCAINNFDELAKILLNKGADKLVLDNSNRTAKQLAEKYKSEKVLNII